MSGSREPHFDPATVGDIGGTDWIGTMRTPVPYYPEPRIKRGDRVRFEMGDESFVAIIDDVRRGDDRHSFILSFHRENVESPAQPSEED